jgi:hypothetical protein
MSMFEHITKSGKFIRVYDDLLPFPVVNRLYHDLRKESFPIAVQNDVALQDQVGKFGFGKLMSTPAFLRDVVNMKDAVGAFPLQAYLNKCQPEKCWVNLFTGYDVARFHGDWHNGEYVSLLYYANDKWDINWDGGTLFRSDDLSEVELYVDYKPGRFVLFNSGIPHKAVSTSHSSAYYRYTINSVYINHNLTTA